MNEEEIEKQLKKSRRQNKDERYEYINSHFNQTNYAMVLEKYTLKILRKYMQLQNNWNELKKWLEEESNNTIYATGHLTAICMILNKMQELEQGKDE